MKIKYKYFFSVDISKLKIMITALLIRVLLETIDNMPYLSIYILKKRVYCKRYMIKKRRNTIYDIFHIVKSANLNTEISYGFNDPCTTGFLCAALSTFSNVDQNPDFCPQYEYVVIDGNAQLYLWKTVRNYFKYRRKEAI